MNKYEKLVSDSLTIDPNQGPYRQFLLKLDGSQFLSSDYEFEAAEVRKKLIPAIARLLKANGDKP